MQRNILFFIIIITIINYFDRSAVAYAILPIENELAISNEGFGFIASAFAIGYLAMASIAGLIVDKFGPIRCWAIAAIFWSIITALFGFTFDFWTLFILRLLLGVTEAVHFPALIKMASQWLDPKWKARSVGIGLLGVPLSAVLGAPFLSFIIVVFSWRIMFFILSGLGILWAICWLIYFSRIKKERLPQYLKDTSFETLLYHEAPKSTSILWKKMFLSKMFIGNLINYFIFGYVLFFILTWLPGFFEEHFQMEIIETGWFVTLPWLASCITLVVGGWASDIIYRRTLSIRSARVISIGICLLITAACFIFNILVDEFAIDAILIIIAMGSAFFLNSIIFSLNADLFPGHEATAQGVIVHFFALSGIIAPSVTGILVQLTGHFKLAFLVTALLAFVGFLIAMFLQKETSVEEA